MKTQRSMHFHVNDPKSRFVSVCPASTTRVVRQRGEGGVSPLPSPRGRGGGAAGRSERNAALCRKEDLRTRFVDGDVREGRRREPACGRLSPAPGVALDSTIDYSDYNNESNSGKRDREVEKDIIGTGSLRIW